MKDMNTLIGNCVRVRASGLPASYDAITMTSFVTFFLLASVVWSAAIGWMTPIIVFLASTIIMFLILMGSKLGMFNAIHFYACPERLVSHI